MIYPKSVQEYEFVEKLQGFNQYWSIDGPKAKKSCPFGTAF